MDRQVLFDNWAKNYDHLLSKSSGFPFDGYERVLDAVWQEARVKPGIRVLDVGTGTGNLAEKFLEAGCEVWASDFSPKMLAQVKAKFPRLSTLHFDLLGDWSALPDKRFERIVSSYVFHEFDLDKKLHLLEQFAEQHLRSDGIIVIGDIAFPSQAARAKAYERWAKVWDEEEHYWAGDETSEALSGSKLTMTFKQVSACAAVMTFGRKG